MDTARLGKGELIAAVSGAVLIIVMFLGWWGAPEVTIETEFGEVSTGGGGSANAWEAADFMDIIWFVTGAVALAAGVATAMSRDVTLPVAASAITAGLGLLSTVLILYRLIDPPFDATRKFGVFIGLIAAAGIAYGGYRAMQEEGTSFGEEFDRVQGDDDAPPPPPPAAPPPSGPPPAQ